MDEQEYAKELKILYDKAVANNDVGQAAYLLEKRRSASVIKNDS
jgi:hypothetical protein